MSRLLLDTAAVPERGVVLGIYFSPGAAFRAAEVVAGWSGCTLEVSR